MGMGRSLNADEVLIPPERVSNPRFGAREHSPELEVFDELDNLDRIVRVPRLDALQQGEAFGSLAPDHVPAETGGKVDRDDLRYLPVARRRLRRASFRPTRIRKEHRRLQCSVWVDSIMEVVPPL
jgi:hypothetical protein